MAPIQTLIHGDIIGIVDVTWDMTFSLDGNEHQNYTYILEERVIYQTRRAGSDIVNYI